MRIKFLSFSFTPVFSFLPWKLPYNIKLLFTCSFFFSACRKDVTFLRFRLITSPLSIKLNDFYCLWDLQPHSFPPSHQFSSFLIPLAFPCCPQTSSDLPYALHQFFKPCLSLFSLLPSHFYQTIFSLYLFPPYMLPSYQLGSSQTAESI